MKFGKFLFLTICIIGFFFAESSAQDWRLSGGYSMQRVGLNYVPNSSYSGEINVASKGMLELELERYLLYRLYVAGKAEYLFHNEETVFLGGPVNFQQVNLGASVGLQWEKFGLYGGVKAGRIWDVNVMAMDFEEKPTWMSPAEKADRFTTALTGGIKYYLLSFLRLQVEVTQSANLPEAITTQYNAEANPAFNSFDFNPLSISFGVSISIPWHSKKRLKKINDRGSVPILNTGPVNFSSPMKKQAIITSPYGPRWNSTHKGVDIDADSGDDIVAASDGVVVKAGVGTGYGKMVKVMHSGGFTTIYAHLRKIKVKAGQKVKRGDIVGEAGNTGRASGVHLHFEVLKNDAQVDPQSYIRF